MRAESEDMKLLKIDDGQGFYLDAQGTLSLIDKITKEDFLRLVNLTLGKEQTEVDEYNPAGLKNQAHQIIYKSIFEKLLDLSKRKQAFTDASDRLFLKDYEKYRAEASEPST